jgi:hypothetical protein
MQPLSNFTSCHVFKLTTAAVSASTAAAAAAATAATSVLLTHTISLLLKSFMMKLYFSPTVARKTTLFTNLM